MSTILIKNGYVIDVNIKENSGIKDILIENDVIKEIDNNINFLADKIIDAKENVIMPGLINTHNHSSMTLFRGYADDLELMDWLKNKIWPIEEKLTGEDIYYGSFLACIEMIKSGTTTFNDMYGFIEDIIKAIEKTGIRATLGRAILDIKNEKDIRIQEAIQLIEKYTSDKIEGRVTFNIAPHSPYICNESSLKLCVELAKKYNIPIHIHLAETKDEVNIIKEKYNMTPIEFLKKMGIFEVPVILAHSVWIDDKDIETLKNIQGGIAHNPISNCKLASRNCTNYKIFRK